jgi:hypothetical protein
MSPAKQSGVLLALYANVMNARMRAVKTGKVNCDSIVHGRLHASPVARQKSAFIRLQLYAPEIPSNHHANFFGIWTT